MRWRRGRDSNPRYGFPYTHFPGVRLRPLGHPSNALHVKARAGDSTSRGARASSAPLRPSTLIHKIHPGLPLLLATCYSEREKAAGKLPRLDKPHTLAELARQVDLLAAGGECK
jgi:hypothetical protein